MRRWIPLVPLLAWDLYALLVAFVWTGTGYNEQLHRDLSH
jgi:hypothetical protein